MPVTLLFMHGWGFDSDFWNTLARLLPEWPALRDDRGYFGAARSEAPDEACVIVAHSFGAMRALAAPPPLCKGLVAINGFDRFIARGDSPGVSPRIVDRMIDRFAADPVAVLGDFQHRCGSAVTIADADQKRLREDLLDLRNGDCTAQSARWALPILSLQGAHDPLLPAPMRDAAFAAAPRAERKTHPTGGHLLPVSDAPYCAHAIRAFVETWG